MTRRSQVKRAARKRYSKEFKDEALALAERLGVPAAAKELGVPANNLIRCQCFEAGPHNVEMADKISWRVAHDAVGKKRMK